MIVGLDAASTDLSVAIADPQGSVVAGEAWTSDRRQSAELLPRLLSLLERDGRALDALTGIGVGTGPGSFTGLRVAMALAKGLAVALGRPIVGVPSLAAWLEADHGAEAAIARAGAREAFVLARGDASPSVAPAEEVIRRFASRRVVAPAELAEAFGLADAARPAGAGPVATEAGRRLAADPAGDPLASLEPAYLRPPRGLPAEPQGAAPWR